MKSWQTFTVKGKTVNICSFADDKVFAAITSVFSSYEKSAHI
jgi:hypothetical protein